METRGCPRATQRFTVACWDKEVRFHTLTLLHQQLYDLVHPLIPYIRSETRCIFCVSIVSAKYFNYSNKQIWIIQILADLLTVGLIMNGFIISINSLWIIGFRFTGASRSAAADLQYYWKLHWILTTTGGFLSGYNGKVNQPYRKSPFKRSYLRNLVKKVYIRSIKSSVWLPLAPALIIPSYAWAHSRPLPVMSCRLIWKWLTPTSRGVGPTALSLLPEQDEGGRSDNYTHQRRGWGAFNKSYLPRFDKG